MDLPRGTNVPPVVRHNPAAAGKLTLSGSLCPGPLVNSAPIFARSGLFHRSHLRSRFRSDPPALTLEKPLFGRTLVPHARSEPLQAQKDNEKKLSNPELEQFRRARGELIEQIRSGQKTIERSQELLKHIDEMLARLAEASTSISIVIGSIGDPHSGELCCRGASSVTTVAPARSPMARTIPDPTEYIPGSSKRPARSRSSRTSREI